MLLLLLLTLLLLRLLPLLLPLQLLLLFPFFLPLLFCCPKTLLSNLDVPPQLLPNWLIILHKDGDTHRHRVTM